MSTLIFYEYVQFHWMVDVTSMMLVTAEANRIVYCFVYSHPLRASCLRLMTVHYRQWQSTLTKKSNVAQDRPFLVESFTFAWTSTLRTVHFGQLGPYILDLTGWSSNAKESYWPQQFEAGLKWNRFLQSSSEPDREVGYRWPWLCSLNYSWRK